MILGETQYKTHDQKLLAIVEVFKTWRHYLEDRKFNVFILIGHNNLRPLIDTKSFGFMQVWYAQELFKYNFRNDYCQSKGNAASHALLRFL